MPGVPEPVAVIWFSPREQQVLELICTGKSSKAAAYLLDISPYTVRAYAARMCKAVGVETRGELIVWGLQNPAARQPGGSAILNRTGTGDVASELIPSVPPPV